MMTHAPPWPDPAASDLATPVPIQASRPSGRRLELRPVAPFRLDLTAWALQRRRQNAIDLWDGHTYRRTLVVGRRLAVVGVRQLAGPDAPRLEVELDGRPVPSSAEATVTATLTRLLGLELDLAGFYARARADPILAPLVHRYRGLKPPRFPTLFECLLNAVACQQLSLAAGLSVLSRLAGTAGAGTLAPPPFPSPQDVLRLSPSALREVGFSERKAHTVLQLAGAAAEGELALERFEPLADDEVVHALVQHPGIGRWSADYVLLRGLGRLHVFPQADVGALGGLRRFLADAGVKEDPATALGHWREDAGLLYFHLLLRGLEQRGALDAECRS